MVPLRETEMPAANRIFVGRDEFKRVFENAAFSIPPHSAILRVFYGAGGQGKTALCRKLFADSSDRVEPSFSFLRRAHLCLDQKPTTDPDMLLVWIRNEFARAGLTFPCFDLALALMWEGARAEQPFPALLKPWLGRSSLIAETGGDELIEWLGSDTAKELIGDAVSEIPGVGFIFKRVSKWTMEKSKRGYLTRSREYLAQMYDGGELKPAYELSRLLPWILAQDLNFHLESNRHQRLVLFIDEYDRVFDRGGSGAQWIENPFDRHLKEFVKNTNGLLCVFFSREMLPWVNDPDWREDLSGHQYRLEGLSRNEADAFLRAVPIETEAVRSAIIETALEGDGENATVYPLMLDLQIDHWRLLKARGQAHPGRFAMSAGSFELRCRNLIERLLRDYDMATQTTIERLCAGRRFDRAAFKHVVQSFGTAVPLDSFDLLTGLSFVTALADGFFRFHAVVANAIREIISRDKLDDSATALLEHFWSRSKSPSHLHLTRDNVLSLFEASYLKQRVSPIDFISWLQDAAEPLARAAMHEACLELWRDALAFSETANGPDHTDTATACTNLGAALRERGDFQSAKLLFERALSIDQKVAQPDPQLIAAHLNNLGGIMRDVQDYPRARDLFERALTASEDAFGPDHPTTGTCCNNLATLLRERGNYEDAKRLLERAVAISTTANGELDEATARSLYNLALLLEDMGRLQDAKVLFNRSLEIWERVSGPEHPATAQGLMSLAALHRDLKEYDVAEPLFARALAISEKANGLNHPETCQVLNQYGWFLLDVQQHDLARQLLERAVSISEQVYGRDHPHTGGSVNNLALLLKATGDLAGAKPLLERALAISEEAEGPNHPSTAARLNNLAELLKMNGEVASAVALQRRALRISEEIEGEEHPTLVVRLNNLAITLLMNGDHVEAKGLASRAVTISDIVNGSQSSMTASILTTLAGAHKELGEIDKALSSGGRAIQILELLGNKHGEELAATARFLAEMCEARGDLKKARSFAEKAIAAAEIAHGPEHFVTGTLLNLLASIAFKQGESRTATEALKRALAIADAIESVDERDVLNILLALAGCLVAGGNRLDAVAVLKRAIDVSRRLDGFGNAIATKCLSDLVDCFVILGNHNDAARHLETTIQFLEIAPVGVEHVITSLRMKLQDLRKRG